MLKKFIQTALLLVVLCTTATTYAQVSQAPDGIQFQALATDANGHPAAGRVIYVKDAIVAKTATGTIVYSETFKVTASSAGIFTIVLGKGTYASGVSSIANIDWANGPFFLNLKIAVEPTVPTASWNVNNEYVDLGTSQFWSVPYALYAGNVKGADGKLNTSDTAAMLKPYFTSINLKANIESPTFTGTVSGITKAMVGLGNVDNTADINKPVSTATQTALDLKANATDVTTALALKANVTDVTTALDLKVDKVAGKALSTNDYTTAEKTKLAAITGTNTGDQDLSALAIAADVNSALALKANAASVANSINSINNTLNTKANIIDVNNSTAALNASLVTKADNAVVTNQLGTKEDKLNKSLNVTLDAASDAKYPSVKAVKTYVDQIAGNILSGQVNSDWTATVGSAQILNKPILFSGAYSDLTGNIPIWNQSTTGNAATATKLAAVKNINGVAFDGSADITITAAASTLSGTVLVANGGTGLNATGTLGQVLTTGANGGLTWSTPTSISVGTISNTSNFNGATITDGVLTLTPADATNGGIITTGNQTINGVKSFLENITISNGIKLGTAGGAQNTMFGGAVFAFGTPGSNNTAMGSFALSTLTNAGDEGNDNTAIGTNAIRQGGTANGSRNTAIGSAALSNGSGTYNNIAIGYNTLAAGISGASNTAVGTFALQNNTTANYNVGIGYETLKNTTTGGSNTAIGKGAMLSNTSGDVNTAIGESSMSSNTFGRYNTAMGVQSQEQNTTGGGNTAIGVAAIDGNRTGSNNAVLGAFAGRSTANGSNTNINNSVLIGASTKPLTDDANNEIVIGYDAVGNGSNTVQLGNSNIANTKTFGTITAGDVTYPKTHGSSGQVLSTNGNGILTWLTPSSYSLTTASASVLGGIKVGSNLSIDGSGLLNANMNAGTISGTVAIANGGTGASTATAALTNLGAAPIIANLNDQTGTTYALDASDNGKVVTLNNASAITLTVPAGLAAGFNCMIVQKGAGVVTIAPANTVSVTNRSGGTKTGGQNAIATIISISSNYFITGGDMQ